MIVAAVVVPSTPLLVPELGGRAAAETAQIRAASLAAASELAVAAGRWVAVGAGPAAEHGPDTRGTFVGYGADVVVSLGPDAHGAPDPELPLPLLVAGWLRDRVAPHVAVEGVVLDPATDASAALRRGTGLAADDRPLGLLVVGDGAATHTTRAPGAFDPRAEGYEAVVSRALADGDARALAGLDPRLSADLWVGGRVPWQVLAGAVPAPRAARLAHTSTPYGVAYHVAVWVPGRNVA